VTLRGHTDRLTIEPLGHEHADGLFAALAHPEVSLYLSAPDVTTLEALHARIDRLALGSPHAGETWLNAAIRRSDDGAIIGRLEASVHDSWAELAYLVGPAYQRRGYGREAVRWLIAELRSRGVVELWAAVQPGNTRSLALLEALGFTRHEPMRPLGSYDPADVILRAASP
jgi:RimJ/RimL family protein N-acetyltransferase